MTSKDVRSIQDSGRLPRGPSDVRLDGGLFLGHDTERRVTGCDNDETRQNFNFGDDLIQDDTPW